MTRVVVTCSPNDSVERAAHDTLRKVSTPSHDPSKPRAKSRTAERAGPGAA
jgi:hypothetical protein